LTGDPVADQADAVTDQADAVVDAVASTLPPDKLLGAYLYGSAVGDGLQSDSDLDVLAVVSRPLTAGERTAILHRVLPISGRATRPARWRPVELTVVVAGEVRPWRYPPRLELQYGEWLRADALAGTLTPPAPRPDLAILLRMVAQEGRPLVGPPPEALLDPVPTADLVRASREELPTLMADLETDTRNVLLTLARMWSTVITGEIRSKAAAAAWAIDQLPEAHRPALVLARAAYLGEATDAAYDPDSVRALVDVVTRQVLDRPSPSLPPTDASV
jgi:predicted nucleotidyltransferase